MWLTLTGEPVPAVWAILAGLLTMIPVWVLTSRLFQQWFRRFDVDARSTDNEVDLEITNPGALDHLLAEVIAVMGTEERVSVPYVIPLGGYVAEIPHKSTRVLKLATGKLLSTEPNSLGANQTCFGAFDLAGASPPLIHIAGLGKLDDLYDYEVVLTVRVTGKATGRRRDVVVAVGFDVSTGHVRCRVGGTP